MENFYYGLKISIRNILSSVSEKTVNDIIHVIQTAGFKSLSHLQYVQEEHLMFILKPIPRRKLIKEWRKPGMIEELYERMRNGDRSWQDEFLAQARNSSESSKSPVLTKSITELLRTNICRTLNSVSEQTLNDIIYALKYAGLELLLDVQFVREEDLTQVLEPIQRRKLVKAWSQQGILSLFSSASTAVHKPITVDHNTHKDFSAALRWPPNNTSSSIPDLSMSAQRLASAGSNHMDTSGPLPNQFNFYIDQTYDLSPSGPPPGVSRFTDHGPLAPGPPPAVSRFTNHGPLAPRPPHAVSEFTDDDWESGPLPGVFRFTENNSLPSERVSSLASIGGETTAFAELSSNVSLTSFKWPWKKCFALLRAYTIYNKTELSSSNINEQSVWKKIAGEVRKYGLQCDAEQCRNQIRKMKCEYETMKHKKPYESEQLQTVFLDDAENAFEEIETPVVLSVQSNLQKWTMSKPDHIQLLKVYAKYKSELPLQNFDVEKQIVWETVAREVSNKCCTYYGKRRCCYEINHLKHVYEIFKKKNLEKCGKPYFFDEARKTFESIEHTGQHVEVNSFKDFSVNQEKRDSNASTTIPDLSMLAQRQAPAESSHIDASQPLPNQFSPYIDQIYGLSSPGPPGVSCLTDHGTLPTGPPTGISSLSSIGDKSIPPDQLCNLIFENGMWKRDKSSMLLKVYARYRRELSGPSVEENHEVWRKIADELHERSNCVRCIKGKSSKRCTFACESECMEQIELLRLRYHTYKNTNNVGKKMLKFFDTARKVFETTKNSVTTFAKSSLPVFKWNWRRRLALLRAYTIYKTELSSSNIKEQDVWKKIADKVGKDYAVKCDAKECHNQIHNMKCEYEEIKHKEPYASSDLQPVFLDEAENAFEEIENPVVFSVESNLEKWAMSKKDHVKLLQVYAKYKEELPLQHFDVEQQIVWGKIAREVSEKCSSFYGKRRCCYEIHNLKRLYEIFKKMKEKNQVKKRKKCKTPYYFEEARRTFESTECTGQHGVNSLENFTVNEETTGQHGVNSLENFIVNKNTTGQHGVNSLDNFTVKEETKREEEERRGWYKHMDII